MHDAKDGTSLARSYQDNDFNNNNLTNIKSVTLNTQAVRDNCVFTKSYGDQFHKENERTGRNLGVHFSNDALIW